MRRYGTEIMAIGAILAGAAIGATGTLALVGNPFEGEERVALECESISLPPTANGTTWVYTVVRDGEVLRKKCPRRLATAIRVRHAPEIDQALQEELATTARALAAARTRYEVARVQEELATTARALAAARTRLETARVQETRRAEAAAETGGNR